MQPGSMAESSLNGVCAGGSAGRVVDRWTGAKMLAGLAAGKLVLLPQRRTRVDVRADLTVRV